MKTVESHVNTVRKSAGLFDHFPMGLVRVRGTDRSQFLHNLLTHDIKGLHPGQGRSACLLDRQGKIQCATTVLAAENEILLQMDPQDVAVTLENLRAFLISEDVYLEEITPLYEAALCAGADAPRLLAQAFPGLSIPKTDFSHVEWSAEAPGAAPSDNRSRKTETGVKWVIRWDGLGVPGFYLWRQKGAALAPLGLDSMELEVFETLRIEAGLPWPGTEITPAILFNELGRDDMVSFTKGCYVGQEIVARIKYRAHPPRTLTGFLVDGTKIPPRTSPILQEGKTVGEVTSSCFSPTLQKIIALGFCAYGVSKDSLTLRLPRGEARVKTHPLPFVAVRH